MRGDLDTIDRQQTVADLKAALPIRDSAGSETSDDDVRKVRKRPRRKGVIDSESDAEAIVAIRLVQAHLVNRNATAVRTPVIRTTGGSVAGETRSRRRRSSRKGRRVSHNRSRHYSKVVTDLSVTHARRAV